MLRAEVRMALRTHDLDLMFEARPGRPVALVGRSGAGKTTLLRVVAGLTRPDAGRVVCDDAVWLDTAGRIALAPEARRCALLHQEDTLFPHLCAWRNVAYGLRGTPRSSRRAAAVAFLDELGVAGLADVRPDGLSGGERRRVALARALAAGPPALLLDEPFTGLDDVTREDARAAVRRALDLAQVPAVVVTHDVQDASALGADVVLLQDGHVSSPSPTSDDPGRTAA